MANLFDSSIETPIGTARITGTESHEDRVTVNMEIEEVRLTGDQIRIIGGNFDKLRAYIRRLEAEHRRVGEEMGDLYDGFDVTDQVIAEWREADGVTELLREETA